MRLAIEQVESITAVAATETLAALLERKGRAVFFAEPDATVYEAIERMAERHVGALMVIDNGELCGVISERDYARKVILQGKSSRQTMVREIMTTPVITGGPSMTVSEGLRLMTEHRIRHLPVTGASGELLGVVSIGDLVRSVISAQARTVEQLQSYIAGSYPA